MKDQLLGLIDKHLEDWNLGNPLEPGKRLDAMAGKSHFEQSALF
ncbi:hypothetical protein [Pseudomonas putida]|nr:hypothetical protein [Pseudomonas putida]